MPTQLAHSRVKTPSVGGGAEVDAQSVAQRRGDGVLPAKSHDRVPQSRTTKRPSGAPCRKA